jgi:hypothetical protein
MRRNKNSFANSEIRPNNKIGNSKNQSKSFKQNKMKTIVLTCSEVSKQEKRDFQSMKKYRIKVEELEIKRQQF